jgi:hypothetical protein
MLFFFFWFTFYGYQRIYNLKKTLVFFIIIIQELQESYYLFLLPAIPCQSRIYHLFVLQGVSQFQENNI